VAHDRQGPELQLEANPGARCEVPFERKPVPVSITFPDIDVWKKSIASVCPFWVSDFIFSIVALLHGSSRIKVESICVRQIKAELVN
jgi:hypothetical protein